MLVVIVVVVNYWLVLPSLFMLLLIIGLQIAFVKASRTLERAELISKFDNFFHSIVELVFEFFLLIKLMALSDVNAYEDKSFSV